MPPVEQAPLPGVTVECAAAGPGAGDRGVLQPPGREPSRRRAHGPVDRDAAAARPGAEHFEDRDDSRRGTRARKRAGPRIRCTSSRGSQAALVCGATCSAGPALACRLAVALVLAEVIAVGLRQAALPLITSRFSAFSASAWCVKLKLPVMTVVRSITITLLCAMAWWASISGAEALLQEQRQVGVLLTLVALVEQERHLDAARLGGDEGLGDRFGAEGVGLHQHLVAGGVDLADHGLGAAALRREENLGPTAAPRRASAAVRAAGRPASGPREAGRRQQPVDQRHPAYPFSPLAAMWAGGPTGRGGRIASAGRRARSVSDCGRMGACPPSNQAAAAPGSGPAPPTSTSRSAPTTAATATSPSPSARTISSTCTSTPWPRSWPTLGRAAAGARRSSSAAARRPTSARQLERLLGAMRRWLPPAAGRRVLHRGEPRHARRRQGRACWPTTASTASASAPSRSTPHLLRVLERDHDPDDVPRAVERVRRRIANVSLDLIFGVPGQTAGRVAGRPASGPGAASRTTSRPMA